MVTLPRVLLLEGKAEGRAAGDCSSEGDVTERWGTCAGAREASPYGGVTFRRALRGVGKVLTAVGGGGGDQWWVCRNNCTRPGWGGRCWQVEHRRAGRREAAREGLRHLCFLFPPPHTFPCLSGPPSPFFPQTLPSSSCGGARRLPGLSVVVDLIAQHSEAVIYFIYVFPSGRESSSLKVPGAGGRGA